MRLWTLHPKYLDAKGLVALWREALLAQSVLRGKTKGYARHPQLARFRQSGAPVSCIVAYLRAVHSEGTRRGYRFDAGRIARGGRAAPMVATSGQLLFEWSHLLAKLRMRNPGFLEGLPPVERVEPHPLFTIVPGGVAAWEKLPAAPGRPLPAGADAPRHRDGSSRHPPATLGNRRASHSGVADEASGPRGRPPRRPGYPARAAAGARKTGGEAARSPREGNTG